MKDKDDLCDELRSKLNLYNDENNVLKRDREEKQKKIDDILDNFILIEKVDG